MSQLAINITGGLIVAVLLSWFGLSGSTRVTVQGGHTVKKTGKWIMIISAVAIIVAFSFLRKGDPTKWGYDLNIPSNVIALTVILYGALFFVVGKIVAWFQRP